MSVARVAIWRTRSVLRVLLICGLVGGTAAQAHKPSDAYLTLERRQAMVEGRLDIALRDVDLAIGLDGDGDGQITWGEVRRKHDALAVLVLQRMKVRVADKPCHMQVRGHRVDRHSDGAYAVVDLSGRCEADQGPISIDYRLLSDVDPQHRGLVNVVDGAASSSLVVGGGHPPVVIAEGDKVAQFASYLQEGAMHILAGFDHLLFLVALLLPAVLVRRSGGLEPVEHFKEAAFEVVRVVTAFTIAHALTLTLATLHLIELPSRWVESGVALSIVVAALCNLRAESGRARILIGFGFGLIHGLGFAQALGGLGLADGSLGLALVAFNLGVELAQVAIALALLPILFLLRDTVVYRRAILGAGSLLIALFGAGWLAERALGIDLQAALSTFRTS